MPDSKLIVRPPLSANRLDVAVWNVYGKAPRNSKSREMQRLLQGGMALQELGILDAVLAVALSGDLQIDRSNPAASVLQTISNAMQSQSGATKEPDKSSSTKYPKPAEQAESTTSQVDREKASNSSELAASAPQAAVGVNDKEEAELSQPLRSSRKLSRGAGLGGMMSMGRDK